MQKKDFFWVCDGKQKEKYQRKEIIFGVEDEKLQSNGRQTITMTLHLKNEFPTPVVPLFREEIKREIKNFSTDEGFAIENYVTDGASIGFAASRGHRSPRSR